MGKAELFDEIREMNLSYLLLAQRMIREDRDLAIYRLGLSGELAAVLDALTPAQLIKMATSTTLLCRFRYDDGLILGMLAGHAREKPMARTHATILGANRRVEAMA